MTKDWKINMEGKQKSPKRETMCIILESTMLRDWQHLKNFLCFASTRMQNMSGLNVAIKNSPDYCSFWKFFILIFNPLIFCILVDAKHRKFLRCCQSLGIVDSKIMHIVFLLGDFCFPSRFIFQSLVMSFLYDKNFKLFQLMHLSLKENI